MAIEKSINSKKFFLQFYTKKPKESKKGKENINCASSCIECYICYSRKRELTNGEVLIEHLLRPSGYSGGNT